MKNQLFQHLKTGGIYRVINDAMKTTGPASVRMVAYRLCHPNGYLVKKEPTWTRPFSEFTDGRFASAFLQSSKKH